MAKASLPATIAAITGHSQSLTFWLSPLGQMITTTPRPPKPATTEQHAATATWSAMVKAWGQAVAAGEKSNWKQFGTTYPTNKKCGGTTPLPAFNSFTRTNRRLNTMHQPFKLHPPASNNTTGPGTASLSYAPGPPQALTLNATNNPTPSQVPIVKAQPPRLAGATATARGYRIIAILPAGAAPPWDITSYYTARFGQLRSGQSIIIELFFGDYTLGAYSATSKATIVIP